MPDPLPPTETTAFEKVMGGRDGVMLELSSRRTSMSFERTRLGADRTLMAILRTAFSLVGFGFTLFQFFGTLRADQHYFSNPHAPRNFGLALVILGTVMLTVGMFNHLRYIHALRVERTMMLREGLVHGESHYSRSWPLLLAGLFWVFSLIAVVWMTFDVVQFS